MLKFEKKYKADLRSKELRKKYGIEGENDLNGRSTLMPESKEIEKIEKLPKEAAKVQPTQPGKGKK